MQRRTCPSALRETSPLFNQTCLVCWESKCLFEGGLQSEKAWRPRGLSAIPPTISVFSTCLILPVVTYLSHSLQHLSHSCCVHLTIPSQRTLWLKSLSATKTAHTHLNITLHISHGSHTFVPISWVCKKQTSNHTQQGDLLKTKREVRSPPPTRFTNASNPRE